MTLPEAHWNRGHLKSRNTWFEHCIPNNVGFDAHFQMYRDIVAWIPKNIHHHRRNTRWTKMGDGIYVQFKKEKDYHWFMLRWA
jgi:hypothetical protein